MRDYVQGPFRVSRNGLFLRGPILRRLLQAGAVAAMRYTGRTAWLIVEASHVRRGDGHDFQVVHFVLRPAIGQICDKLCPIEERKSLVESLAGLPLALV